METIIIFICQVLTIVCWAAIIIGAPIGIIYILLLPFRMIFEKKDKQAGATPWWVWWTSAND